MSRQVLRGYRHNVHKKDYAYVLIVALSFSLLFLLVGMAFMSSVEFSSMMADAQNSVDRADLMAQLAQSTAQMWLEEHAWDLPGGTFYGDYEERLASVRGHMGDPRLTAEPTSRMTPDGSNLITPIQIALRHENLDDTQGRGVVNPSMFAQAGNFAYMPSIYRARPLEDSTNPSLSQEVFEDDGVWDAATETIVGANDNRFTFLDDGPDGLPETSDPGEGNGRHDVGEPSELFSDVNANGVLDAFTGGNFFGDGSFACYGIKMQDANGMIHVNGGQPENPNRKANFPFVPVFYGDCSAGYSDRYYMTRNVNLPTLKLLNNLGIILSRVPGTDAQIFEDPLLDPAERWFDAQGRPKGLWIRNLLDPDGPPLPIFGPASQDPAQRRQLIDGVMVDPVSPYGLGDILILASQGGSGQERKAFTSMEQIRAALVNNTTYPTGMTNEHFELLRDFMTIHAWVDETTLTGAKFWDPAFNDDAEAFFHDGQFMTHDFFNDSDVRRHDIDVSLSVPRYAPEPDPFRLFSNGDPWQVHRRDQGSHLGGLAVSRSFLGSARAPRSSFVEFQPAGNAAVTTTAGFKQIDRAFPLIPGRWDAGFDKDTESDNLFGVVPEKRAPINLNAAPAAVLEAVFMGLEASYVTDAQNNLWPNRDLLKPILSRSLFRAEGEAAAGMEDLTEDIRFEDRTDAEMELGMVRPYLYQWHEDYHTNYWPRSEFVSTKRGTEENGRMRRYQLPEWDWIGDATENQTRHYIVNPIASLGIDIAQDWYRLNPTIEMTPSVVIYPLEAHELAKAIVNYRKGWGTFADVGLNGVPGGPDSDELGGENNGRLDYNEDYHYTAGEPDSLELIPGTVYRALSGPNRFKSWEQFMIFLDCVKYRVFLDQLNDGLSDADQFSIQRRLLADLKVDLVFANANPNSDLLRFNPNASFASYNRRFMNPALDQFISYDNTGDLDDPEVNGAVQVDIPTTPAGTVQMVPRNIDKLDLFTPGERWVDDGDGIFDPRDDESFEYEYEDVNGNGLFDYGGFPTHTTELIFEPSGTYHVETVGKAGASRLEIESTKTIRSVVRFFSMKRLNSQRDFEGVPNSKDVGAHPDNDFAYNRALHSRDTDSVGSPPRLRSYPEFDPTSWTSDYQMAYDRPQPLDRISPTSEKVWRWVRNGTTSFRVPSTKGLTQDQTISQFYKSPAAIYDGQLALPTREVTQAQMAGPGQDVFSWALRFYIRFNGRSMDLNNPVRDDLNAWYFNPATGFGELGPRVVGIRPAHAFDKRISMRNTNNLDMVQKGLMEPEFWGIGTYSSNRFSAFAGGSWGLHRNSRVPDAGRREALRETQAYRHWPESIPKYDREGGLTADGLYKLGIRNLIYDLRNGPQGVGGVPGYGPKSVQNQSELPSIFRKDGTSWADDDGRNLYITMWVKPAYSGNGRPNRYAYDSAEQFIKPHRLPNPVVWALSNQGTDETISGLGRTFFPNSSVRYPREFGTIEDTDVDGGAGNQGFPHMPWLWQALEKVPVDPNQPNGAEELRWTRSEYWAKTSLPVERPDLHSGAPSFYGFPVWWKQTVNPIPPFGPFQSGTIHDRGTAAGFLQSRFFGPIYTTIPNMLMDLQFYWAAQPWADDTGNVDPHHPFPQFKDHEAFNNLQIWHDIASSAFNHEVNGIFNGTIARSFKPVIPGWSKYTRIDRDPIGVGGVTGMMHMPGTPPGGATNSEFGDGFRNDSVWGNERNRAYPFYGRPLTARLTRYVNVFKAGMTKPNKIVGDPNRKMDGRFLHWAVYDPPARNLQYDSNEDFLMKKGEWVRVSYAIKEPVSSTPLSVPSRASSDDQQHGYHKIWVFGTPNDFAPDPEIFTRSVYETADKERHSRIYQGWWINRPQIGQRQHSASRNAAPINYWDTLNTGSGQTYDGANWPNQGVATSIFVAPAVGANYLIETIDMDFGGQDAGYFGRLEQVNLGPGFAGTLDEYMILGGIGPEETVAVSGSTLEAKIRSIESFPILRDRYHGYGNYTSPVITLPPGARVAGVRWSEFIPYSLKRPEALVNNPDAGANGETSVLAHLMNNGETLTTASPLEMPDPDKMFPGRFIAQNFRVRLEIQATVHDDFVGRNPVRSDRLLDTPMVDDILILYSTGLQILFWEEKV